MNLQQVYNASFNKAKNTYPGEDVTDFHARMLCALTDVLLQDANMFKHFDANDYWWKLGGRFYESFNGIFLFQDPKTADIAKIIEYAANDQKKVEMPREPYFGWYSFHKHETKEDFEKEKEYLQKAFRSGAINKYQEELCNFKKFCSFKLDCLSALRIDPNNEGYLHLTKIFKAAENKIHEINEIYLSRIADIEESIKDIPNKNRAELKPLKELKYLRNVWNGNISVSDTIICDGHVAFLNSPRLKLSENTEAKKKDFNLDFNQPKEYATCIGWRQVDNKKYAYLESAIYNTRLIVDAAKLKFAMNKTKADKIAICTNSCNNYVLVVNRYGEIVAIIAPVGMDWDI